jgi:ceramide glucosyltransferase
VVIDCTLRGENRKVSNLINMLAAAKHETLVMSDADIHVPPYFLSSVISALEQPGVGLVTTLYTALPGTPHLSTMLGANQINYSFLPGALLARRLGRQDCLGVTMALSRQTLALVGGLQAVANHLADDQVLGRLVQAKGLTLTLAKVIPATTVPESNFRALFNHELRWARTIRALVPLAYAGSALQMSLFWAMLCLLLSGGFWAAWLLFFAILLVRYGLARRLDAALRLPDTGGAWIFVLRDLFSIIVFAASFCGSKVEWRGQQMRADSGKVPPVPAVPAPSTPPAAPSPSAKPLL